MPSVAVSGAVALREGKPGHAWVFLQYLLGFRRLGWDVLFLDCLPGPLGPRTVGRMVGWLQDVMSSAGLDSCWSLRLPDRRHAGLSRSAVVSRLRAAEFLINVNGFLDDEELLSTVSRRVFLDIDPGFVQMWRDLGLADVLAGHDDFVTVGARIGAADCSVPTLGLQWIHTRPPVVIERWPVEPDAHQGRFSTIATWRGPFGPLEHGGTKYGLRVHEFRRFLGLPRATGARFEVVLDIDREDESDRRALEEAGWDVRDPASTVPDLRRYREYITQSKAEVCIAKSIYVRSRCGWFSDRSACYLATGRPVLAQDTGFSESLPTGEGLLTFNSMDSAVTGVHEIDADLSAHSRAARRIAEEYFDSDVVLTRMLRELERNPSRVP